MAKNRVPDTRYTLFEGFFDKSLPKIDKKSLRPAAWIYMDCDYYSSTRVALEFCKDLMQDFTIVYFDDLFSFSGNPFKGQLAALREFNESHKDVGLTPCPILDRFAPGRIWWAWKS
jgi:O-methyltransferase